jgi:hypothetical protein
MHKPSACRKWNVLPTTKKPMVLQLFTYFDGLLTLANRHSDRKKYFRELLAALRHHNVRSFPTFAWMPLIQMKLI